MVPDATALDVPHGIEVLTWPRDAMLRRQLARLGVPRLVLFAPHDGPPTDLDDPAEAWLRADADADAVGVAVSRVLAELRRIDDAALLIDEHGVVRRADRAVVLSASESVVAAALIAAPGRVVSRQRLQALLSAQRERGVTVERNERGVALERSERALEAVIYRLRQRLVALHVVVRTVRSRGFALDVLTGGPSAV